MTGNPVRRLDDLGRIIIPKEIRKLIGAREGSQFEITVNTNDRSITLKPYATVHQITDTSANLMDIMEEHREYFNQEEFSEVKEYARLLHSKLVNMCRGGNYE